MLSFIQSVAQTLFVLFFTALVLGFVTYGVQGMLGDLLKPIADNDAKTPESSTSAAPTEPSTKPVV